MACTLYIHSFKVTTRKFHHHIPLKTFLTSLTAFKVLFSKNIYPMKDMSIQSLVSIANASSPSFIQLTENH